MTVFVSVVICSHNPRQEFIERTLAALKSQTLPQDQWELLIIDNASRNPLKSTVDISWHCNSQVILEKKLGLTPARLCGINHSQGKLLIFVDDDNILNHDYLEKATLLADKFNIIGAFGGNIMPDFMGHVHPEWTKQFWELLALRNIPKPIWSNTCSFSIAPCGAGMVVRKEVASHYIKLLVTDPARLNLDRKGNSLISGGDTDMAFCACDLGMGIGMFPELKMEHIIPPERMTVEYLEKLSFSIWYSGKILESFRGKFRPEQKMSFYSKLRRLGRYVLGKHSDPVFRCGLAAERGRQAADQFLNNQSRNVSLNSSHHTT